MGICPLNSVISQPVNGCRGLDKGQGMVMLHWLWEYRLPGVLPLWVPNNRVKTNRNRPDSGAIMIRLSGTHPCSGKQGTYHMYLINQNRCHRTFTHNREDCLPASGLHSLKKKSAFTYIPPELTTLHICSLSTKEWREKWSNFSSQDMLKVHHEILDKTK